MVDADAAAMCAMQLQDVRRMVCQKTGVDRKRRATRRLRKRPTEDSDDSGWDRCSVRAEPQKKGERVDIIQQRVA